MQRLSMKNFMIMSLKVLLYAPELPGMKKVKKITNIFLNLEKSNKKRSSVRKIFLDDGKLTTNPKTILSELEFFYSNLYKDHSCHTSESTFFDIEVTSLSQELRSACEGRITYNECFSALQSFQKNKTPGNDGLTAEFYLAFWSLFGKYIVDSMYGLLTKCEVKMAGYWPSSFFACLWTETKSRSINSQKKNEANIQPS